MVIGHDHERAGWVRLVYTKRETFSYFPLGNLNEDHEINLTLGRQDKNYETHFIGTYGLM